MDKFNPPSKLRLTGAIFETFVFFKTQSSRQINNKVFQFSVRHCASSTFSFYWIFCSLQGNWIKLIQIISRKHLNARFLSAMPRVHLSLYLSLLYNLQSSSEREETKTDPHPWGSRFKKKNGSGFDKAAEITQILNLNSKNRIRNL